MLAMFAVMLAASPVEGTRDWREFDRRQMGVGESPFLYDAASLRRDGAFVYVWIRYQFLFSGLPDPTTLERLVIDCPRRRTRTMAEYHFSVLRRWSHRRIKGRFEPIPAGSSYAALADRLCR